MFSIMVHANGYDLPITQWPVDFREENAGVFYAYIAEANFINSMPDTFIYGWLGIFTAPPQYGVEGSGRFTQVGIKSENGQIFWEMESERPILNCLRNSTPFSTNGVYLKGCRGQANDLAVENSPNAVSISHDFSNHQWIIQVADNAGRGGPVAVIDDGTREEYEAGGAIYNAAQLAAEHYWGNSYQSNPYNSMSYYFYSPYYGSNNYVWPSLSGGVSDYLDTTLDPQCNYVGIFDLNGDPHQWYLGVGGTTCSYTFNY